MIDTAGNRLVADIAVGDETSELAMTPNGSRVYVASGGDGQDLWAISTATNQVLGGAIALGGSPHDVAITPDGSRAYVPIFIDGENDVIRVIDLTTHATVASVPVGTRQPSEVAFLPDGSRAYATNAVGDSVSVIAITPDGSRAYVTKQAGGANGTVSVVDPTTNALAGPDLTARCQKLPTKTKKQRRRAGRCVRGAMR